jgi:hypothetical protein
MKMVINVAENGGFGWKMSAQWLSRRIMSVRRIGGCETVSMKAEKSVASLRNMKKYHLSRSIPYLQWRPWRKWQWHQPKKINQYSKEMKRES